jgi:EmrB/QacA subfamily drug resistance transporter
MDTNATAVESFHGIDPKVYARRWWTLAVLCTSLMVVIVGNTALNIALPTLGRDLDASITSQQWMVDAYALVFAGLLFTAGAIGDRFGRKGALQIGLLVFLGGSVFAALNDSAGAVILGRAIMGVGAAFVMPSTLSIISNVFPPHERTRAIAIWAGIAGGGAALGPVMSGFLLEHFWWGSVFLVNVPIIAFALIAGRVVVPTSRDPEEQRLDVVGALLSIAGIGSLVYAIIEAPNHGWTSPPSLMWFALAIVLLVTFVTWERRTPEPMLNMSYFRDRRFSIASGSMALVYFAMFGTMFLLTQYLQLVLGYGTLEAGLKQLPFPIVLMAVAPNTPKIAARVGANRMVGAGLGTVGVGLLSFAMLDQSTPYLVIAAQMAVFALGMALTMSPLTASIMSSVPRERAGAGSAMNDTSRELGGALGVAVLGSLVASQFDSKIGSSLGGLSGAQRSEAESSLAGALHVAQDLPGTSGAALVREAQDAFLSGFHLAAILAATVAAGAAIVAWRLLPQRRDAAPRPVHEVDLAFDEAVAPTA